MITDKGQPKTSDGKFEDYQSSQYHQSTNDNDMHSGLRILVPVDVQALVVEAAPTSAVNRKD